MSVSHTARQTSLESVRSSVKSSVFALRLFRNIFSQVITVALQRKSIELSTALEAAYVISQQLSTAAILVLSTISIRLDFEVDLNLSVALGIHWIPIINI